MSPTLLALFAYATWGIVPIYWKLLPSLSPEELILYRVLLSALFLGAVLWWKGQGGTLLEFARNRRVTGGLLVSSLLIGFNWYLYVWAVAREHVVEASLGYFLNPLMNVALGTLLLDERMRRLQWGACALAALGAGVLVWQTDTIPWIALSLASSFALYGLIRKKLGVRTLPATLWETLLLCLPCALALTWMVKSGVSGIHSAPAVELWLLPLAGVITSTPLLAFAEAAKHLPLTVLGFIQFLSPTIQFLLGVFVYHEPFGHAQWIAFSFIWAGLFLFLLDSWHVGKRRRAPV